VEHILVIGGGIGGAIACDLALRGFKVTLLEKGELLSGATGRHHGLLHSGARYVLHDLAAARECWQENQILRRLAPQALEQNDGLFVAVDEEDRLYRDRFLEGCRAAGIPTRLLSRNEALALEPHLNPALKEAVAVPDATMDAWRLPMHFFATARLHGADIRPFSEVVDITTSGSRVTGVKVVDHVRRRSYMLHGDVVVNAAGAWGGRIAAMLDIALPLKPGPGVMVSVAPRLTRMVVNRLHPAGDGDIIVPQRNLLLLGTTAWLADDPDRVGVPRDHVQRVTRRCAQLVPRVKALPLQAAWSASRPLIVRGGTTDATRISRTFDCIDHGVSDGCEGFISVLGGKATTMRAMAEKAANLICAQTGRTAGCPTRGGRLLSYRRFFQSKRGGRQ
jgi:glycerol-3-phosphate dehydrogenase